MHACLQGPCALILCSLALKILSMQPPPQQLQALVTKHASVLLPRTFPEHAGKVRAHPVTRLARDLGDLLSRLDALHGPVRVRPGRSSRRGPLPSPRARLWA